MTLRVLWLSDRIIGGFSAYSKVSRECCVRLAEMGHTVAHVPMGRANLMGAWTWRGVLILPSGLDPWGEDVALRHYLDFRADVLVTLKDVWVFRALHRLAVNFVPYVPVAHSPVSPMITSRLHTALAVLVPSRFGQRELMRASIEPPVHYVPHGVDTGVFRPLEDRAACKRLWFLEEDDFTVLVVAFNRARKMLDRHLRAFKRFREDNPDIKSHMILWTDVRGAAHRARDGFLEGGVGLGVADVGVDLLPLIVDLGLEEDVIWPETRLAREGIPDWSGPEGWDMVKLYSAADVLLGITGGEGFFLPAIEAQACGTPVIVTDYAAAPEVCGCGYCVPVADWAVFSTPGVRWALADVGKAAEFLARVANSDRERMARRARRFAERFDWGRVMRLYWGPLLEELEAEVRPLVTREGVGAWETPGAPALHVWG